jgi:hypothetical protein
MSSPSRRALGEPEQLGEVVDQLLLAVANVLDLAHELARGQPLWDQPDDECHEHAAIVPAPRPTTVQQDGV